MFLPRSHLKYGHDHAETAAAADAIAAVETEQPSFGVIVVIATTEEERSARIREAGVITVPAVQARVV